MQDAADGTSVEALKAHLLRARNTLGTVLMIIRTRGPGKRWSTVISCPRKVRSFSHKCFYTMHQPPDHCVSLASTGNLVPPV